MTATHYRRRPTPIEAAVAELLIAIYRRPWAKLGPIAPPPAIGTALQAAVGLVLSLPDEPARIELDPHPLWLGWWLRPAPAVEQGEPVRARLARGMARIAEACGRAVGELGDEARELLIAVADELIAQRRAGCRVSLGRDRAAA